MPTFIFRPINVADIASAVGKSTIQVTLGTNPQGVITVTVPTLTAGQRTALKGLFTARGYVEHPAAVF